MQSRIYTVSRSLSFRCELCSPRSCLEPLIVMHCAPTTILRPHHSWALHARQLLFGSSLNHIVLGKVCFDTTCNILDNIKYCRLTPQTNMVLFYMLCPHFHIFRETSQKVTHPKIASSQGCLTVKFLWN